ncbi:MAG: glycine oxidase ThiO [Propionibacteriaceae bacterium]
MSRTHTDVVVVGGGLIGSAVGWRLSQRGLSVTVVDDGRPGAASQVSAGMLAPVTEATFTEERLLGLNLDSMSRFDEFATELELASGQPSGLSRTPTLSVGQTTDDAVRLADLGGFLRGLGLDAQPLLLRSCRQAEPLLSAQVRGGLLVRGDWSCDSRLLWSALRSVPGVTRRTGTVSELVLTGGQVSGVRLAGADPELAAGTVVLAGGSWSGRLELPIDLPIRPIKGQILRMSPRRNPKPVMTVRAITHGTEVYAVPHTSGYLVVGATVEELGFDLTPTGQGVYELLRDIRSVLPVVMEYELAEVGVGLRPCAPDNAPILGPTAVPGLVLATGHYRNGVLLTPVTADAIADLVVEGSLPGSCTGFTIDRFAGGAS